MPNTIARYCLSVTRTTNYIVGIITLPHKYIKIALKVFLQYRYYKLLSFENSSVFVSQSQLQHKTIKRKAATLMFIICNSNAIY